MVGMSRPELEVEHHLMQNLGEKREKIVLSFSLSPSFIEAIKNEPFPCPSTKIHIYIFKHCEHLVYFILLGEAQKQFEELVDEKRS